MPLPSIVIASILLSHVALAGDKLDDKCADKHGDDLRSCLKKNFANAYDKVEAACDDKPKGPDRFACRQAGYAKQGVEITASTEDATAATSASAPAFATFASTFGSAVVAGNTSVALGAMSFPVSFTWHPLNTADGKTFTLGTASTKSYDRSTWEKVATCGNAENGEIFANTPQWRCDLFYGYSGMSSLIPGTTVVDEAKHTIQTAGYDSTKAAKGLSMTFVEKDGAWLLTTVHETYYVP